MKIVAFTKSFQDWTIPAVCHRFREIGLDGLDLTVRRNGMIAPGEVELQLPLAAKAASEAGVEIPLLTSDITQPTPEAEKLLATASKLGIGRIKLGYYLYKPFGTLAKQLAETRQQIAEVVNLAKKYHVLPCIHIHANTFIPSHGTMLYELIRDMPPSDVGAYVDTLHMALEGGGDGWRQGLDLLAPWIQLVAVKNFHWHEAGRDSATGQLRWRNKVVPIADGVSPLPEFIATLKKLKFDGVYSLHSEYKGSHSFKDLDTEGCLAQTVVDLKHLRGLLGSSKAKI